MNQQRQVVTAVRFFGAAALAASCSDRHLHNSTTQKINKKHKIAIVGASGAVGEELIMCLAKRNFPLAELRLYASAKSCGRIVNTSLGQAQIEEFTVEKVRTADLVFLATTGSHALANAHLITAEQKAPGVLGFFGFTKKGPVLIDNSNAFRYIDGIPLIVPEINGSVAVEAVRTGTSRIIANPNCTTAIAAMALWPLHKAFGLEEVIVSTYQASSGQGAEGMSDLKTGTLQYLTTGEPPLAGVFQYPLPFNVIPQIDVFMDNGYTKEEMKVAWETRKIFGLEPHELKLSCTAVRIPTLRAHSEAITIRTKYPISPEAARAVLVGVPGLRILDDPSTKLYPMPLNCTNEDDVAVGRIRQSLVHGDHGLDLFVCGDQLLRGAALNAVLIAELVLSSTK